MRGRYISLRRFVTSVVWVPSAPPPAVYQSVIHTRPHPHTDNSEPSVLRQLGHPLLSRSLPTPPAPSASLIQQLVQQNPSGRVWMAVFSSGGGCSHSPAPLITLPQEPLHFPAIKSLWDTALIVLIIPLVFIWACGWVPNDADIKEDIRKSNQAYLMVIQHLGLRY